MQHRITRKAVLAGLISALFLPVAAHAAPAAASNAELLKKIEALTQQLELLKSQVQATQASTAQETAALKAEVQASAESSRKASAAASELQTRVAATDARAMEKWLTIGGDYQFRVDSLRGETRPFVDVNATFANVQQSLQGVAMLGLPNPTADSFVAATDIGGGTLTAGQSLAALANFSQEMSGVGTYDEAMVLMGKVQLNTKNYAQMMQGLGAASSQVPSYKPRNTTLYSNRFGLDLGVKAAQDVSVNARLLMYKNFGANDDDPLTANGSSAPYFSDRVGVFDGTLGHVPSNSYLNVDRVYATLSNIADQDMWFSVGRRPATHGAPTHLRANTPRPGNGGVPALLVDYAFDGMVLGWAPDIDDLPGAYAKLCYGRGFESGFRSSLTNSIQDTDMLGFSVVPIDTDPLRVWLQWNRGMDIFDAPTMANTYFGNTMPKTNLGDIDWYGIGAMGTIKKLGIGDLNWFADAGISVTHPNSNVSSQFGFQGLLTGAFFQPEAPEDKTGNAVYLGVRYDLPSKTKIGLEYNHGSKNWITFAPAAGDSWTSKVGTRGNVYEAYLIQELDKKAISSNLAKAFFRFGFQYYDFEYSGSNNWVGAPVKISTMAGGDMTTLTPLDKAYNAYATFEVKF